MDHRCGVAAVTFIPAQPVLSARSAPSAGGGGRSGRNPTPAPLRESAISPVGRVALPLAPPPMHTAVIRSLFLPTLSTRSIRVFAGPMARTGGRPRGACEEGGTTAGADLLSGGHSPHCFAWSQALLPAGRSSLPAAPAIAPRVLLHYRPEAVRLPKPCLCTPKLLEEKTASRAHYGIKTLPKCWHTAHSEAAAVSPFHNCATSDTQTGTNVHLLASVLASLLAVCLMQGRDCLRAGGRSSSFDSSPCDVLLSHRLTPGQ
jgi:hypothetical protein